MFNDIIEYITFTIDRLSYFELMFYALACSAVVGAVGGTIELIIKKLKGESMGDSSELPKEEAIEVAEEPIEQSDWEDDGSTSDGHYDNAPTSDNLYDNDSASDGYRFDDRSALVRYLDEHEGSALERYLDREEAELEHYWDDEYAYSTSDYDVFNDSSSDYDVIDDTSNAPGPSIPNSKNEGWYDNTDYEDPADMYDDDEKF